MAALGLLLAAAPALADTVVVGYVTPSVAFGAAGDTDGALAFGEVRASGVVVTNLEPGAGPADTRHECPAEGCGYQLLVVDPAALRDGGGGTVGCDSLDYGVVDPDPEESDLGGGGRLYTGQGQLPDRTVDSGSSADPARLAAGIGQLCFANPAHDDGLTNDAGDGPLAATQPTPLVVFHAPDAAGD